MNCKFCDAQLQDDFKICPYCGNALNEEEVTPVTETEETCDVCETPVDIAPCDCGEEIIPESTPKKKVWPLVLAIVGAVVALGVLAVVLLTALGVDLLPKANDIHKKETYIVSDEQAGKKADTVVATIGKKKLTNATLQIYYRMQVLDFLNYYGDYVSYLGLDYTQPLSEQICAYDETLTWEQYFLNIALETWQNYQTLAIMAEESGFALTEEWQESLDNLPADLEEQAKADEYESVDAMLKDVIGPGCTLDRYLEYVELAYLSSDYYNAQYEKLSPSKEDTEAYFAENEATFAEQGITKESGLISSVRHILVIPEGGTVDEETGVTTYTEDQWKACLANAEKILQTWKDGEATEASFAELANKHSEDSGSNTSGGLYEGIYKDSGMVEPFETWSIAEERKTGDVGIVKADFEHYKGYHIIYFVSGEPHWFQAAETQLLSDRTSSMLDDGKETWPMNVKYNKISFAEPKF